MKKVHAIVFIWLIICLFSFFSLFLSTTQVLAQASYASKIVVTPEHPKSFEDVTLTLEDFSQNLNAVTITWFVNGQQKQKGVGLKTYSFKTGALGTVSQIDITAGTRSYNATVRPVEVDLIWEATDSYTPPFYEGKGLLPNQGGITVAAIPNIVTSDGKRLDAKTLIYKWKKGGSAILDQSGYGRNVIHLTGSLLMQPEDYEVSISSVDGKYNGYGSIEVEETSPSLKLYENDPLYGIKYENSLNDTKTNLSEKEIRVVAIPFFFSTNALASNLQYSWGMNGSNVAGGKDEIVLRKSDTVGISSVNVTAKHLTNFMQSARATTQLEVLKEN